MKRPLIEAFVSATILALGAAVLLGAGGGP
jgi:hypothetical protein